MADATRSSAPPTGDPELVVRVDLDVPGETSRQARVFAIWLFCLATAVTVAVVRRPYVPPTRRSTEAQDDMMAAYRRERFGIAVGLGLILPGLLTWWVTHRRRRGGPHPRGIRVAVTPDGQLLLWGRGYGQRLRLQDAELEEFLVDVYTGRLGAWRQRRLRIRAKRLLPNMPTTLELATLVDDDTTLDLPLVGGEGDCVELTHDDFEAVRAAVRAWTDTTS